MHLLFKRKKHAKIVEKQSGNIESVEWKDYVTIEVKSAYKSTFQENKKLELFKNQNLFKGIIDVQMEKSWNPYGLCEGLLGMKKSEEKSIYVELPRDEITYSEDKNENKIPDKEMEEDLECTEKDNLFYYEQSLSVFPAILDVKCLNIKTTLPPVLDDAFFLKLTNKTKDEIYEIIETEGLKKLERKCKNVIRGALLQEISKLTKIDLPETLIQIAGEKMWKSYLEEKKINTMKIKNMDKKNYENDEKDENDEEDENNEEEENDEEEVKEIFQNQNKHSFNNKGNQENDENEDYEALKTNHARKMEFLFSHRKEIEKQLKIAITLRIIRAREKIEFDISKVSEQASFIKLKVPESNIEEISENIYRVREAESVLDWLADKANITFEVDHTPVKIKVELDRGERNNRKELIGEIEAFPRGANESLYRKQLDQKIKDGKKIILDSERLKPTIT